MKIYCIPGGGTPASVFFQWVPLLKGKATVRTLDYARTFSDQSTPSVQGIAAKLYEKIQAELDGRLYAAEFLYRDIDCI